VKAFILGLPNEYRGQALERDLDVQGIPFESVPGSDARQWSDAYLDSVYSARAAQMLLRRQLAPGEVACTLGHQEMMARFVDGGGDWGLLLEDDARIIKPLAPVFGVLEALAKGPVIVQLDARGKPLIRQLGRVEHDGGALWRQPEPAYGSAAYLINRAAATAALRSYRNRRVDSTSDWPICWAGRVQFWVPDSSFVSHPTERADSTIERARIDSRHQSSTTPKVPGLPGDVLKILGVRALYGRLHNIPFLPLYRRDLIDARTRLRARGQQRRSKGADE
jgi:hypothetical protein